jgi:hypothetical protein
MTAYIFVSTFSGTEIMKEIETIIGTMEEDVIEIETEIGIETVIA